MKNLYKLCVLCTILVAGCSKDETNYSSNPIETLDLASDAFQNSNAGIYNGVFTTIDGQERGSIQVTIPADETSAARATLSLSSGEFVILEASHIVFLNTEVTNLFFESTISSFYFSVEANGNTPEITNINIGDKEAAVLIKKHTTRAPVVPIPGTYVCDDCGTHPVLNNSVEQSFNILMFTTPDGDSAFDTEVTLGMNVFNGTGMQDNCVASGVETSCDMTGSFMVSGAPITWSGIHTFNNETTGPQDCSGASGTWTFESINFGTLTGTFESDASCTMDVVLYSENFDTYTGAGFAPMPAAGQLDSNMVIVEGLSDGDILYGGTGDSGDFARGINDGGTSSGGVYSFEVEGAGSSTLGIHPGGSDFTPGYFEFRIENTSGMDLSNFSISYDLWVNNDQNRANSLNFSYSTDGISFSPLSALDYTSGEAPDTDGFVLSEQSGSFAATVTNGGFIFFRFEGDDVSGSGSRDEFAIDNIVLTGN